MRVYSAFRFVNSRVYFLGIFPTREKAQREVDRWPKIPTNDFRIVSHEIDIAKEILLWN